MPGVKGDFARVSELVQRLTELGSKQFRLELNERLGAAAITLITLGFERGVDPYGKPWKPTISRDGQTLRDRGRLQNSFTFSGVKAASFAVGTNAPFASVHQYGATIVAKNAKALRFQLPVATRIFKMRGKGRLKTPEVLTRWVMVKKVTIPQRQMVPENTLGPIWMGMVAEEVEAAVLELMDLG